MNSALLACSVTDWIQAIGVLVGVGVAYAGLQTWRTQLHGTSDFEAKRGLLLAAFRLRNALQSVRRTATFGGVLINGSDAQAREVINRVDEHVSKAMFAFEDARAVAEAIFGSEEIRQLVEPIQQLTGRVRSSFETEMFSRIEGARDRGARRPSWDEFSWASDDPSIDAGTRDVNAAFSKLESWARVQ